MLLMRSRFMPDAHRVPGAVPARATVEPLVASPDAASDDGSAAAGKAVRPGLTVGKVFALSSQERPVLLLAVLLRLGSEGCSFASPLILATAYDAVVESYGHEERGDATREVILRTFTWVLALHVAGQALGFLSGFATGLSGERVVSRLRTLSATWPYD